MERIKVDTTALKGDVDKMREDIKSIKQGLDGMYQAVKYLDTMWDGPANDAFNAQFMQDERNMAEICKDVEKLIEKFHTARVKYDECETQVGDIVSKIKG